MKRSEVNKALRELEAMCEKYHCYLPPFCHFTPEEWETKGHEYDEVRDCCLGWDITDFGMGDFSKTGFSLITIRNGNRLMADKYPKVYAEKLLYLREGQHALNHFHWYKTEDIINRGGGNVLIRVYNSLPNEEIDYESDVLVQTDAPEQNGLIVDIQPLLPSPFDFPETDLFPDAVHCPVFFPSLDRHIVQIRILRGPEPGIFHLDHDSAPFARDNLPRQLHPHRDLLFIPDMNACPAVDDLGLYEEFLLFQRLKGKFLPPHLTIQAGSAIPAVRGPLPVIHKNADLVLSVSQIGRDGKLKAAVAVRTAPCLPAIDPYGTLFVDPVKIKGVLPVGPLI